MIVHLSTNKLSSVDDEIPLLNGGLLLQTVIRDKGLIHDPVHVGKTPKGRKCYIIQGNRRWAVLDFILENKECFSEEVVRNASSIPAKIVPVSSRLEAKALRNLNT